MHLAQLHISLVRQLTHSVQGSKLTVAHLPEASSNSFGQVIFWLNLPDGEANKIPRIKQHQTRLLIESQFRLAFVALK